MSDESGWLVVGRNRKARHEYEVMETYEAGMVLKGAEVKSLRNGGLSFQDAFARVDGAEVFLYNLHISPYEQAPGHEQDPMRTRKLLLNRAEIRKLVGGVEEKGLTLIPLSVYFKNGYAKVELALARGRKLYDKREKLKRQTQEREAQRAMDRHS